MEYSSIKYDYIIFFWYSDLEKIKIQNKNAKMVIIDFHMLWWLEWNPNIINLINENHIPILSCFPKFHNLYINYGILEENIVYINFAVDNEYADKIIDWMKSQNINNSNHILIPWNHKRDYILLFDTIKYLEKDNIFLEYKIIDWSISNEFIDDMKKKYLIKSNIIYKWNIKYKEFLIELYNSKFLFIPLQNIKWICNWLTAFAVVLSLGKLLLTNLNITTISYIKNWNNCLCWKSDPETLGKLIKIILKNQKLINKISKNAYNYSRNQLSFENLSKEIDKIIN